MPQTLLRSIKQLAISRLSRLTPLFLSRRPQSDIEVAIQLEGHPTVCSIAMDATKTAAKAVAAGNGDGDAAPSAAPKPVPRQEEPLPGDAADPAPAKATTSATVAESGVEDEQVERFYALLANIRAMRGMNESGSDDAGASSEGASEVCGGGRKRARWAEPPWRPAFRMEDFEDASASKKDMKDDGAASHRRPGKETKDEDGGKEDDVARNGRGVVTPSPERKV
ncbi:hypothetical protein CFC21_012056 [Triticum aestivum]|uniref:Uncharacterized protein n=5 Tax=Triticinae TaxID=1648030 RepID=A0A452YYK1_AEGTS|nr:uncharacterized protein LOC109746762 [Aegilops tauschii subsp. strangulata]KAF6995580.1 hypothetical protein CFC21_012056 [Triticum aestivum]